MRKVFGQHQILYEHAVTRYADSGAFLYDRIVEGHSHLEATIAALDAPLDGLLGFSQGANFSTIMAARAEAGCDGAPPPFKLLVLLENDQPGWPAQLRPSVFGEPLMTPALVVGGQIQSEAADAVGCLFANPTHLRHGEGHRPLPKQQPARDDLLGMIRSFIVENSCE